MAKPDRALKKQCARALNMLCASASNTIITVKNQLFRLNQAADFPIAHAHCLGTRLGCSWQQPGKFLKQPCFSTDSKRTAMQKPGYAKTFRLSQAVHKS